MVRICIVAIMMCVSVNGIALGQGFFESVFGPSGLGLTSGNPYSQATLQRFNSSLFYGGNAMQQTQSNLQRQYGARGYMPGQPPQQAYPQYGQQWGQYYDGPGIHPDWAAYPPASWNPSAGPVQYQVPQQQYQQVPQQQYQQVPQQQYQQVPQQQYQQVPQQEVTTTPEGTTIQYYGPPQGPAQYQEQPSGPTVQPRPRRAPAHARPQRRVPRARQPVSETAPGSIAMPEPSQVPPGQVPRSGWGPAVNRGLAGSRAR